MNQDTIKKSYNVLISQKKTPTYNNLIDATPLNTSKLIYGH